jgi:hypothetical protein
VRAARDRGATVPMPGSLPCAVPRPGLPGTNRRCRASRRRCAGYARPGGGKPLPVSAADGPALQPDAAGADQQQYLVERSRRWRERSLFAAGSACAVRSLS